MDVVAQAVQQRPAQLGQLQRGQVVEAEPQHCHAEAEFAPAIGPFHEAHHLQRGQQPEHRRARHLQPPRQLRRRQRAVLAAELTQQPQPALQPRHDVLVLCVLRFLLHFLLHFLLRFLSGKVLVHGLSLRSVRSCRLAFCNISRLATDPYNMRRRAQHDRTHVSTSNPSRYVLSMKPGFTSGTNPE
ncbi:hypothetical protein D3C86_1628110 [compost metagenome]